MIARLDIEASSTTLAVRDGDRTRRRANVLPFGEFCTTEDFRAEADRLLAAAGLHRTGEWHDVHGGPDDAVCRGYTAPVIYGEA